MTVECAIRLASSDDLPAIERIVAHAYRPYVARIGRQPAPMTADYRSMIASTHVLVADDVVVGLLITVVKPDHLFIENVAITPRLQGHGYGRFLLDYADDLARASGLSELRLYTNAAMTENLALYPRLGYSETSRRTHDGFDRVFFAKSID